MRVVLAQCTTTKRDCACEAKTMYTPSRYFRAQRTYAETHGDTWFIQSAKHGLLAPTTIIEPYDVHARHLDDPTAWAEGIARDLSERTPFDATVDVLGGKAYADPLTPELESYGYDVHEPLRGLKIGERQAKLKALVNESVC